MLLHNSYHSTNTPQLLLKPTLLAFEPVIAVCFPVVVSMVAALVTAVPSNYNPCKAAITGEFVAVGAASEATDSCRAPHQPLVGSVNAQGAAKRPSVKQA